MIFVPGQRWVSEARPELGLGLIMAAETGRVRVFFPAAGETLTFATKAAPLRRVSFEAGDTIKIQSGDDLEIAKVRDSGGVLTYVCAGGRAVAESELHDLIGFSRPEARLLGGHIESSRRFNLRTRVLFALSEKRRRPVRGLLGGRIDLIPHQLYIADEVSKRYAPRVLLADEVGLGKTIEAALILHRMLLNGRAKRALVVVPESLVHQWFVELLRRFSLHFSIYDEERCAAIQAGDPDDPEVNPFLDDQLVLTSIDLLAGSKPRGGQAADAGWDILVVDEAHHLEWTADKVSPEYSAIEKIAARTPGLLLLTATPEQLAREGHFARLRLLDPNRFSDLEEFAAESSDYAKVSSLALAIESGETLTPEDTALLETWTGGALPDDRETLLRRLLDLHGTGRVMFRNLRKNLGGFPPRQVHFSELDPPAETDTDPRIAWLATLLADHPAEKILLICADRDLAEWIDSRLSELVRIDTTVFHGGLTLIQRDRNAAWFADEDGARLMICSEIGSEGRNFQFAHRMVLYDLPDSLSLLEQRIGRLDRIGQTGTIHIHVPFIKGTPHAGRARWYHEGLDAFERCQHGTTPVTRKFGPELEKLSALAPSHRGLERKWTDFIDRTKKFKAELDAELERGRDRLLEMSSFREKEADAVVDAIVDTDVDSSLESFMLELFENYGVTAEDIGRRSYILKPGSAYSADAFPGIREEGMTVTFDRTTALAREDVAFITWDHPFVASAIEYLTGLGQGNSAFATITGAPAGPEQGILLECIYLLECVAPDRLHADRFLPITPIRIVVDHRQQDQTAARPTEELYPALGKGDPRWIREKSAALKNIVPQILARAADLAESQAVSLRGAAEKAMSKLLGEELARLQALRKLGHPIRPEEFEASTSERADLTRCLASARLRLDSVRLILLQP